MTEVVRRTPTALKPLDPRLSPPVLAWVRELRTMWAVTGLSINRFSRLNNIDKGTVSRYLNGQRVPRDRWFLDRLLALQSDLGKEVVPQVRDHLAQLQLSALETAHPQEYRVRLVTDELEVTVTRQREAERYANALEKELAERIREAQELVDSKGRLRAAWDAERAAQQAVRDRLDQEITELTRQLALACQRSAQAEKRCQQLEELLAYLETPPVIGSRAPNPESSTPTRAHSRSTKGALRLMEAVASHPNGAPAKQLAREARMSSGAANRLLRTLADEGYARKLPDGAWVLGDQLESLHAQRKTQQMLVRVRATLTSLRDELQAASSFGIFDDGAIRILDIADSPRAPRVDLWAGFYEAGHATAIGRCMLAHLDEDTRRDYLARNPLIDLTPRIITEPRELDQRLMHSPSVSFSRDEHTIGVSCAAVPVTDAADITVGALAVSFRSTKLPKIEASIHRMEAAASEIGHRLSIKS